MKIPVYDGPRGLVSESWPNMQPIDRAGRDFVTTMAGNHSNRRILAIPSPPFHQQSDNPATTRMHG
jgi:hypothetical protein